MLQDPALFERMAWQVAERMPVDTQGRVLLVTSARPGEGRTFVAGALAAALNLQNPGSVALVECAESSASRVLPESTSPTFGAMTTAAGALSPERDLMGAVTRISFGGNPGTVFRTTGITFALDTLRKSFGYVVLDGPVIANCGALSNCTDGVLLVVNARKTTREIVGGTLRSYPLASQKMLGVILNERPYYVPEWLYGRFL